MDFRVDDHSYWPKAEEKKRQNQIENRWQDISERMETEMETFSKEASQTSGNLIDQVKVENRERMDYREFLRKFSVLKEEMTVDPDSFDYTFYSYGLTMYGNMPLIEPQEWKEVQKDRRICYCDRYIDVLFGRIGEKISGGDLRRIK